MNKGMQSSKWVDRKYPLSFFLITAVISGAVFSTHVMAQQSEAAQILTQLFGHSDTKILYSEQTTSRAHKLKSFDASLLSDTQLFKGQDVESQKIYLSPNREYIAVSIQKNDHSVHTYIVDTSGNVVVPDHAGNFKSWSPDSTKVLLYIPIEVTGKDRKMYVLDLNGNYYDSNLPPGVFNATISPKDGSIVYSLTDSKTDNTDIYLRTPDNKDKLLIKGTSSIFAWARWSPDGSNIAFLKSDLYLNGANNEVLIANSDGAEMKRISNVAWNYPPVWSPDGNRLLFAHEKDVFEYDVEQKLLTNLTNASPDKGNALQPVYSSDGETVIFSQEVNGVQQIWGVKDKTVVQLTSGGGNKSHPLVP